LNLGFYFSSWVLTLSQLVVLVLSYSCLHISIPLLICIPFTLDFSELFLHIFPYVPFTSVFLPYL
jgi:hypothetical protein